LQDNKHGRGIRCDLIAVQFAADDVAFGEGATDASGLFGAVAGGAVAGGAPAAQAGVPGFAPFQQTTHAMPAAPFAQAGLPSFLGGQ
jgi:hypothetical protein